MSDEKFKTVLALINHISFDEAHPYRSEELIEIDQAFGCLKV